MDDINGTGDVVDYTGRNNGTVQGNASQTDDGYFGKGFEFDGDGESIKVTNAGTSLNLTYNSSISVWAKLKGDGWYSSGGSPTNTSHAHLIYKGDASAVDTRSYELYLDNNDNRLEVILSNGTQQFTVSSDATTLTDWHHYLVTWNDTSVCAYLDGSLSDCNHYSNILLQSLGKPFWIGAGSDDDDNWNRHFNGTIDDVMIFNRSLSAEEIAALYANQTTKYLEVNYTNLTYANYTFKAYAQDRAGNVNSTETRVVNITSIAMAPIPETHIIRMILTLSNLNNYVYIPGTGEVASSAITNASYTSPDHWYIASYLNNALNALVFVRESPNALMVNRTSSEHSIAISQALDGSKSMLAFTSGDWEAVDNRIESIESGGFMNAITPSFAHGLGVNYMIKILVNYADIDMVNELILSGGSQGIEFSNTGVSERKITLNVSAV